MNSNTIELVREDVVTINEIKMILEQYCIGKKPLAKLLGWGETTIIRYMEGDVPTNEYSSKLKMILDDPEYYYELLRRKQECLTNVAYKKSKKAVLSRIMATKIYAAAYYIINLSKADMCAGYLQYLLYYTQAFSLAFYDTEIFQEDCGVNSEHMPYLKLYEGMKQCKIHTLEGVDEYLSTQEKKLMEAIIESFGWYGPKGLHALSTFEKSIIKVTKDKYNNKIISKEGLKKYFTEVLKQYQINSIEEIHKYPDAKIMEIREFYK